ncbi:MULTISPECIES: hypothetical protein [Rhizobium]|uniref:BON domain-containing protein n=2 Tax=Rhizobium TaxID=379 RepID=A0ABM6CHZ1_9HYPH|nr:MULTISPECIES: hypothetical protein [Rhizobium]AIC31445.1 BON domain-containing protein [Rhizobium sp. IE4771]ANL87923.1 BON domain-containing protein [Rhizobium phaseoli]ANL94432.1 BON domain-containing protein [Rhizobium phaseoli]
MSIFTSSDDFQTSLLQDKEYGIISNRKTIVEGPKDNIHRRSGQEAMSFEPESLAHDQLASVQAAVSIELESSSISVSMVGRSVLLEGYVADYGDREKATAIAARRPGKRE